MAKQSKPKQIKLSTKEIELLLSNIAACNLDSSAKEILSGLINSNGWLIQQLQEGKLNINKLKRLFACVSEPNNKKDWKAKANKIPSDNKGHGRTHSDKYTGAEEIELKHDDISVFYPNKSNNIFKYLVPT